jgi:hypothetical protein
MNRRWAWGVWSLLPILAVAAQPTMTPQEQEAWFDSKSAAEVNEGTLSLLPVPPAKPVHHHQNRIAIHAESLATGWTELAQCHDNLDRVPRAQITFREGYIKDLRVTESQRIGQAWVDGSTIQLREVASGARLCIGAKTRALKDMGAGYFNLFNGPYMRKFLDGYYPMRVSLTIEYPGELLQLIDVAPAAQPGFNLQLETGRISIDTVFEGELRTLIQFERRQGASPDAAGTP